MAQPNARHHRGQRNHHAGESAEAIVAQHYQRAGHPITAERWRGDSGELDLVAQDGPGVIFIEVKAARSFEQAAQRVDGAKVARLYAAGSEYLAQLPLGQDTQTRFDVALVDGTGRVEVLENALMM